MLKPLGLIWLLAANSATEPAMSRLRHPPAARVVILYKVTFCYRALVSSRCKQAHAVRRASR